ncbi:ThiF family adenylyltransferase [Candidatus Woesearchaeota archaeon]|nr:ThiF family adenylyltransferase [Candidatus Woesearchaeota archaeon]
MRYEKQELFKEIGKEGQKKLAKATIAIVGLGALGSVSAEQLARAGIGKLILFDHDIIEVSNLQRQTLYDESDINKQKQR